MDPTGNNPMQGQQGGAQQNQGGGMTPPPGAGMPPAGYPPQPPQGYYPPMPPQQPQGGGMMPPGAGMPPAGYPPQPPQGYYPPMPPQQPQGGGMMPPGAGMPPAGYPPQPPMPPQDTTPANFQLGAKLPAALKVKVPAHSLQFNEEYFIRLLAGSISLSKDEKKKIIDSIPKLRQAQVDELINIFEEEKQKFAALPQNHTAQLEKLAQQHFNEWMDIEAELELNTKKEEDQGKAEEIRKQLGL